jgi:hypothetical protein
MKTRPVGSELFRKDCNERHGHDKGCFSNFGHRAQEPTHAQHRQYTQMLLSYYFIKHSLKLLQQYILLRIKLFYYLQNSTELYEINWTLLLSHCD